MTINEKAIQVGDGSISCEMSTVHTWHATCFTDNLSSLRITDTLMAMMHTMFIMSFQFMQ